MAPALIALEEHFDSNIFTAKDNLHANLPPHLSERLQDVAELRLKEMDAGNISMQVLSHIGLMPTPVAECQQVNDKLASACAAYPDRLAGFATLLMQDPEAAAAELERSVKNHKFLGALINSHLEDGTMFDDPRFWPVFAKAVELDVPIYIHPNYPGENLESYYKGSFSQMSAVMMSTAAWGWHSSCGLGILRLFAAGLFDRCPTLKIVIGHMGEMIPYMLERTIHTARNWGTFQRNLRTVWNENVWVTTSGLFTLPPLECLLKTTPVEHVMFSLDYPFSGTETGRQFVEEIEKSGLLNQEQFEGFCHGNSERLLKIKGKQ
ncbi:Decarboxylase orsB [Fulvia fulva]|uniref:Decarboxylase orsB n=1 Tax=Passalora fulva TaxID=5499 RepID=A0A9Q8LB70_PASFU|nr:Decarboxylase orsB [Fulvia fulva]KAK4631637.1 Decarboxylase orsB [Fulvia fulva]KAK4633342.1 Decarboxylase orsB [Fulvia fulva]UJO14187.1 Decarboxylase orsB [Fulvia fulva]WPV10975.1 Decarboxylase orsB [Fulvia fulva]WPV25795.1 Decarboxylase orsB [Fulvia fulva]